MTTQYTPTGGKAKATEAFETTYRKSPEYTAFTPYRVCPIGAHSDHQLGKITGFAIDKGIHIAYGPKMNGVVEISSLQFAKRAQWHVSETPGEKQGDWADHLRGATIALNSRYPLRTGLCAVLDGELPIGGLSSSAAVIITFLSALCRLNGVALSSKELIEISKEAENKYVGVSCGKLDQSCEVYCRKDNLLYMDMKDDNYYTKADTMRVKAGIAAGCGTDAPGSYIAWLCGQTAVHAMEMPGSRYDIGNLESYETVEREYKGMFRR